MGSNRALSTTPRSVGVVICAHSEERWERLAEAVASVSQQSLPAAELVVVIDHNPRLLARASSAFPWARVMASGRRAGLSGARNTGLSSVKTDVVAFLDDDAAAAGDWLRQLTAAFDDPAVVGAGGWVEPCWASGAHRWLAPELYWIVGCSYRGLPSGPAQIRNPIGANMAFRRSELIELGGFREDVGRIEDRPLGDEETDLAIRAHTRWPETRIMHVPSARVQHAVPAERIRWSYLIRRCFAEGRSKALLAGELGAGPALASERTYATRVLPRGVVRGLLDAARGDLSGFGRAASIVTALAVTGAGYALGRLAGLIRRPVPSRPSLSPATASTEAELQPTRRRSG